MMEMLALLFGLFLLLMIILYRHALQELRALKFSKQSLSTKYGKMTEQFMPFMKDYPYDSQKFRFIGTPIDGIQFEPDKVVFVEFKTGSSNLSAKQKAIKDLVLDKKVEFREVRIDDRL